MEKLNPTTYEEWMLLDKASKEKVSQNWNVYEGEGLGFALCAAGRLILSSSFKVIDVRPGVYHGGEWVLHAYVGNNDFPEMPMMLEQEFDGFRIIWMQK